jgi:hypothetical protein
MKLFETRRILLATFSLATDVAAGDDATREMSLREGPDSVFDVSVETLFPALEGAQATGRNGRVGNELVFWGYRLDDDRDVALVACAMLPDVDCTAREKKVCPGASELLARSTAQGLVRRRTCRAIALAAPGDVRPGCVDRNDRQELAISLLQCR